MQRILESEGFKTKVAENGADGVEIFKTYNPDLIFMDVRMPVMDGLDATKKIRQLENGKTVKIVGVSAHVFKDEIESVLQSGMNDFIKKPYHFNDIYKCLQKQLNAKFIFHDNIEIMNPEYQRITVEMFKKLDEKLLLEIKEYIENLNNKKLLEIVERVSLHEKELSNVLYFYFSNYKVTEVYNVLKQIC
ncbi:response regulator, partial [Dolichospermum sp. ST_sed3]|nr:response regulator [Dolichospermum sp. ST_sed3]